MNRTVTVRREGDALAVAIPDDMAARMDVHEGDELHLVETDHGLALVPTARLVNEDDRAVLDAFDDVVRRYDGTLRRLAQ
jgi:antitoxin component of MazEF toxin-antitoxin module